MMKSRLYKSLAACLAMFLLAALCTACGKTAEKPNPTAESLPPAAQATEETLPPKTPAQRAMALYAELLEAYPSILPEQIDALSDLTLGYEDNLSRFGMHYDHFSVEDLDGDGVPELLASTVINTAWAPVSVYEYNAFENQLYLLKNPLDPQSHATFEQMATAGGANVLYVCKDGHLHSYWSGDTPVGFMEENHAYVLAGEEGLVTVECPIGFVPGYTAELRWQINDAETRASVFAD